MKNALSEIWRDATVSLMTAVGRIPDKEVNTEAKLKEQVDKMEKEYLPEAKAGEVRKGLWTMIVAKTEGEGMKSPQKPTRSTKDTVPWPGTTPPLVYQTSGRRSDAKTSIMLSR